MTTTTTPAAPSPGPAHKKSSAGKWILRIVGALLLLLIVVGVIVFFSLDTFVKMGVERGGEDATNQKTSLDNAKLSLSNGTVDLNTLSIADITGYKPEKIFTVGSVHIAVQTNSLFTDTVNVPEITIDGAQIYLEQNGLRNNLGDLLDAIKQKTPAGGDSSAPAAPGKKIVVGSIKLTNTKVHITGLMAMDLDLGPIEIKEPTNPDGRPMKIADVIGKVLIHITQQILENPQLPGVFKDQLAKVNQMVGGLDKVIGGNLQGVTTQLGNVLNQGAVKDLGQNLGNQTKDLGKNLGGLFGQKK